MNGNIYTLRPDRVSHDTIQCLATLLRHAKTGAVTGIGFVAFVEGHGYIVNSAGDAYENPTLTRGMIQALDNKLALRIDGGLA